MADGTTASNAVLTSQPTIRIIWTRDHPSSQRYAQTIAEGFSGRNPSVTLHGPTQGRLAKLPGMARLDHYLSRWVTQPVALHRLPAEVFHLVDDNGQLSRWLPWERTVVTCHDLTMLQAGAGLIPYDGPRWYLRRFEWGVARLVRAASVICPSQAVGREVVEFCGVDEARVTVIPHGVAAHFVRATPTRRSQLHAELAGDARHVLLHVDTGGFYKNVRAVLRTLSFLRSAGEDVILVRVGSPLRTDDRLLAHELGVSDRILNVGRVSERRLVEIYNGSDVLIFPSYSEGFGWPVLEAMACGVPVVTSDIEVLRELSGLGGLHASPYDPEGLASAVRTILASPERAEQISRAGRERSKHYTWTKAVDAYEKVYTHVAG